MKSRKNKKGENRIKGKRGRRRRGEGKWKKGLTGRRRTKRMRKASVEDEDNKAMRRKMTERIRIREEEEKE